jgi:hypothetical protein
MSVDVWGTAPDIVGEAVEGLCEQERLTREIHRLTARENGCLKCVLVCLTADEKPSVILPKF